MPRAIGDFKVCSNKDCELAGIPQPVANFHKHISPSMKDGLQSHCKKCQATRKRLRKQDPKVRERIQEMERLRYKRNPERFADRQLFNRYGITLEDKRNLWARQRGLCKCCGNELPFEKAKVDHCHATGAIRAILCNPCNQALGLLLDSPDRCYKAAAYLERFALPYVLPKAA